MIALDLIPRVAPLPGELFVQRDERLLASRYIEFPDDFRLTTRSSIGTVRALGPDVAAAEHAFAVGDRVLLLGEVGRTIPFGERGEVVFEVIRPYQVAAIVLDEPETVEESESPLRHFTEEQLRSPAETLVCEGDPRGLG